MRIMNDDAIVQLAVTCTLGISVWLCFVKSYSPGRPNTMQVFLSLPSACGRAKLLRTEICVVIFSKFFCFFLFVSFNPCWIFLTNCLTNFLTNFLTNGEFFDDFLTKFLMNFLTNLVWRYFLTNFSVPKNQILIVISILFAACVPGKIYDWQQKEQCECESCNVYCICLICLQCSIEYSHLQKT